MDDERSSEIGDVIRKGLALLAVMALLIAGGTWFVVRELGLNDTSDAGGGAVGTEAPVSPLPTTALPVPDGSPSGDASDGSTPGDSPPDDPYTDGPSPGSSVPGAAGLQLGITPLTASPMERLNITGTYVGHDSVSLQVQRLEGGTWADFPTQAQVNMGTFETYVKTSHPGPNKFRVYDPSEDKASNVVTIIIR